MNQKSLIIGFDILITHRFNIISTIATTCNLHFTVVSKINTTIVFPILHQGVRPLKA